MLAQGMITPESLVLIGAALSELVEEAEEMENLKR